MSTSSLNFEIWEAAVKFYVTSSTDTGFAIYVNSQTNQWYTYFVSKHITDKIISIYKAKKVNK